jgi:hypothetical protein
MKKTSMAGLALRQFIPDVGVPEKLTSDGASEQTGLKSLRWKILSLLLDMKKCISLVSLYIYVSFGTPGRKYSF